MPSPFTKEGANDASSCPVNHEERIWAYVASFCQSKTSVGGALVVQSVFRLHPSPQQLVCQIHAPIVSFQAGEIALMPLTHLQPNEQSDRRLIHSHPSCYQCGSRCDTPANIRASISTRSSIPSFGFTPGFGVTLAGLSALTIGLKVSGRTPKRRLNCNCDSVWAILEIIRTLINCNVLIFLLLWSRRQALHYSTAGSV